jgi:hypothetical protein
MSPSMKCVLLLVVILQAGCGGGDGGSEPNQGLSRRRSSTRAKRMVIDFTIAGPVWLGAQMLAK